LGPGRYSGRGERGYTNADAYCNGDCHSHCYRDRDANCHCHRDCNSNRNCHCNFIVHTHTEPDPNSQTGGITKAASHASAAAIDLIKRRVSL
jgi:hypothetical protein